MNYSRVMVINMDNKKKFDKCIEYSQTGYCCDAHPSCRGCDYNLPDDVYVSFGGKLSK